MNIMATPTLTPAPSSNQPHGYKSWSRKRKVLTWTGGTFGGLVAISMISNAVSPAKPAPASHASPVTHSAPAKPAPKVTVKVAAKPAPVVTHTVTAAPKPAVTVTHTAAPKPAPAKPAPAQPAAAAPSAMADWCTGLGAADMAAVVTDAGQLSTDASNYDITDLESDGGQLQADAATAGLNPPPVSSAQQANYRLGMASYSTAGSDAASGDFTDAASALDTGTSYINQDQGILPAGCTS
jgi:hypothetical protein